MEKNLANISLGLAVFSTISFVWAVLFNFGYGLLINCSELLTFNDQVITAINNLPKFCIATFIFYFAVIRLLPKNLNAPITPEHLMRPISRVSNVALTMLIMTLFVSGISNYLMGIIFSLYMIIILLFLVVIYYFIKKEEVSLSFKSFAISLVLFLSVASAPLFGIWKADSQIMDKRQSQDILQSEKNYSNLKIIRNLENGILFIQDKKIKFLKTDGSLLILESVFNWKTFSFKCYLTENCKDNSETSQTDETIENLNSISPFLAKKS